MRAPLRWVYDLFPVVGQNAMCTLAGQLRNWQRYDRHFAERRHLFQESAQWDLRAAENHQLRQLQELLAYCHEKVPYYRERMAGKVRPEALRTLEDWRQLDTLAKDDARRAGASLISADFEPSRLVVSQSGGSTGMPLRCYHDRAALKQVYAFFWAAQRPGMSPKDKYATFQGLEVIPARQTGGPYWRMNHAMRQRLYSIFHLSEKTIGDYLADLDRYQPVYLAGYANSLYLLATLAEETGRRPTHSPKAIFTTSEQLLPAYRQTIERVFRTRVWDAYSQDETCGSITQYECGFYHYDRAYGYMEFEDVEILPDNRRLAEIICTGFFNRAWPLLRYRPGDLVEYEPTEQCPKCGRAGPIIHAIRGRTGDVLLLPSGRRFPHISLIVKNLRGVRQVQCVQHAVDRVTIRFVPNEDFRGAADVEHMTRTFAQAVNETVSWQTEAVSEIPRTRGGKFMSIVSCLPANADKIQSPANGSVS
jgi:phenylacetate-CoA ligase